MPEPLHPSLRVRFSLEPYPVAAPTIYRWGVEALPDLEFTEGRLTVDGYTEIERALSGSDGHYQGATFTFTARDDDRLISALLASGTTTEFFLNREASLELLSSVGRAAGLAWRTLFRGHITDAQEEDLEFRATLQDVIGSEFSSLALDRPIARTMITRDAFPNAPEGVVNTPYYLVFGEHSDQGSVDQNGEPNEKGMIPLRFLGWAAIGDDGSVGDSWPARAASGYLGRAGGVVHGQNPANVVNGAQITIGAVTYTFESVFTDTAYKVLIGGSLLASKENLVRAIGGEVAYAGVSHGTGTVAHALVTSGIPTNLGGGLNTDEIIVVHYVEAGTVGNSLTVSSTDAEALPWGWDGGAITTLQGGEDAFTTPPTLRTPSVYTTVLGTPGTTPYVYAVSGITATGETRACADVVVPNGPTTLNSIDKIQLDIGPPLNSDADGDLIIGYRVLGRKQTSTHLVILNKNGTWTNPETTYIDDGSATEKAPGAPAVSTAIYDVADGAQTVGTKAIFGGLLGAVRIKKLFLSDGGGEGGTSTAPKRVHIPQQDLAEALTPTYDDGTANPRWPHADKWVVRNGIRSTQLYLNGVRAQDAIDGRVTIAAQVCGYDASGNQTGPVVDGAFPALQLLLNEFVLKSGGEGYKDGAFGPLETFEDGTAILRTSAFTAAQTVTEGFIAGGYKAAWCISDPNMTLRQFLQQHCLTFNGFDGINEHGQFHPVVLNPAQSLVGAPRYREHVEIVQMLPPRRAWPEIVNKIIYRLDWDTDGQRWRYPPEPIEREPSRGGYKGPFKKQEIDGFCTRDLATMVDAQNKRLDRLQKVPIYWSWITSIAGIEQPLGQVVLLTHTEYGLVDRPVFVTRNRFNPNTQLVTLTGLDVSRVMTAAAVFPYTFPFALSA